MAEGVAVDLQLFPGAPALHEQLGVRPKDAAHWQRDLDALNRLMQRELLNSTEATQARRRLRGRIEKGQR